MSLKDRIKAFIEFKGIEIKTFETQCELSNGFVNNIGHSIREKSLNQIQNAFPELNKNWLLTGVGNMINGTSNPRLEAKPISLFPTEEDVNPDNPHSRFLYAADGSIGMKVSVIPHKAQAGYRLGFADPEFYEDFDYVIIPVDQQHKSEYLGFEVVGESMVNFTNMEMAKRSIFPGRIAIGRSLSRHQWAYKLHTHNYSYWVIVHKTEGILIKEISKHDVENGIITIHSLNPDYEDEDLHLDDVEQIFSVVQILEKTR